MKNFCTICLILSVVAVLVLAYNLSVWAIVAACFALGFATLENHYQCISDEQFYARELEDEKQWILAQQS